MSKTRNQVEAPLVAFFRDEAPEWGDHGDFHGWTPVETALHYLRAVRAGESLDAADAKKWRQFSALPFTEEARRELAQFAALIEKIGRLEKENRRLRSHAEAADDALNHAGIPAHDADGDALSLEDRITGLGGQRDAAWALIDDVLYRELREPMTLADAQAGRARLVAAHVARKMAAARNGVSEDAAEVPAHA